MPQDGDNIEPVKLARRGPDGLAQIGPSRFDAVGLRFARDNEGADGADDADDEDADEQDSKADDADDEQDSDDGDKDGFDGEFDAPRARRTIDRLRRERKAALDAAKAAKNSPELTALQKENLRLKVALKTGLDSDIADRLRGDTEDELLEDAQKLIDRFFPADKKLDDRTPKPRLRGGSEPGKEPELSADDIVKKALSR